MIIQGGPEAVLSVTRHGYEIILSYLSNGYATGYETSLCAHALFHFVTLNYSHMCMFNMYRTDLLHVNVCFSVTLHNM